MYNYKVLLVYICCSFASSKDVPITWLSSPRASLPCVVPDADRIVTRRPPPPLNTDDKPQPRQPYLWRRGEENLKRVLSNGTLEVSRKKDGSSEGVYQCAVRHYAGLVLGYPLHLKFAYLDKHFSVHPENGTAWLGQPYVLSCTINSGPAAIVSWLRDGEPLPESDRYHVLNNQLLILDVTKQDAGLYRCKAANPYANRTRVSYGGRLQVQEYSRDEKPSMLPIQQNSNISEPRGATVTLACPVTGYPRPTLIWESTPKGERTGEMEQESEVLVLRDLDESQEGIYACHIAGHEDMFKTFDVSLSAPVKIILPPTSKQALQASTVRFNCTAVGNPTPTITWYKNGKPLMLTGRIAVRPSPIDKRKELLIRSVTSEDAGVYQCFAHNAHSGASAWAALGVSGGGAAAPAGVRCWPLDPAHVLVRWPKVNDSIAYTVQVSDPDGQSFPVQPCNTTEQTITLAEALSPYEFQVRAYVLLMAFHKNVASGMSKSVTCHGQGVPIKVTRLNDGVHVSWRQFASQNPGVKQWILQYRNEDETAEHNITLEPEVNNYTISTSSPAELQVRLLGTKQLPWLQQNLTLVPWWPASDDGDDSGGLTGKIDSVEITDVGATKFTVHWRCAEAENLEETFTYMVCTQKLEEVIEECIESIYTWVTIEGLTPSTEYSVRVRAQVPSQPHLKTEFTEPMYVFTKSAGSNLIKDLKYKVINESTLRVSWDSVIDKYTVYYNSKLELPITHWSSIEAIGNTVLITNVDTSKDLYVMVSGYDPVGYSTVLHVPVHVTEPKELNYTFTSTGLTVMWKTPEARVVRYSQNLTQSLEQWTTINGTGDTMHITGLDPSLHTYIEVTAPSQASSRVFTVGPRQLDHTSDYPSSEAIKDLTYKMINASTLLVSWNSDMDKYTVYYNNKMELPINKWPSVDTMGNTVMITNVNASKELYVIVSGYDPVGYSSVLHVPMLMSDASEFNYTYTNTGLTLTWQKEEDRWVRYSQNLTQPLEQWTSINMSGNTMNISGLKPSLFTYVLTTGQDQFQSAIVTVPPRQPEDTSVHLSSEPIMDLKYKVINASTLRVSWNSDMDKYTVYYNSELKLPINKWPSVDTRGKTVLITNVNTTKELYVVVLGYHPVGYSFILHIPVHKPEAKELNYTFTSAGLRLTWQKQDGLMVRYSQNLSRPLDQWNSINGTGDTVTIPGLNQSLFTYVVVTSPGQSARVLTVPSRLPDNPIKPREESIRDLTYKVINGSTYRVSWNSVMDRYTVYYSRDSKIPVNQWHSVGTVGNSVLITNVNTSKELFVIVHGYDPVGYSSVLHIPAHAAEANELNYAFTSTGLTVMWKNPEPRVVYYSQNLTKPLDQWTSLNVTDNCVHITGLDPLLLTYVVAMVPGQAASQVLTVPPRPVYDNSLYLGLGIGCPLLVLCVVTVAIVCIWRRRKRARLAHRSRRRSVSPSDGNEEEMTEMRSEGSQLANGRTSKDAGEPLLNGHVHITENPIPMKTPNGRMRRGQRYEPSFDMSRYEDTDETVETVLNSTSSTAFDVLDTSRSPDCDLPKSTQNLSTNNSFNKLPDDNMNSELTRSTDFQLDNSKILPTLQPNG